MVMAHFRAVSKNSKLTLLSSVNLATLSGIRHWPQLDGQSCEASKLTCASSAPGYLQEIPVPSRSVSSSPGDAEAQWGCQLFRLVGSLSTYSTASKQWLSSIWLR